MNERLQTLAHAQQTAIDLATQGPDPAIFSSLTLAVSDVNAASRGIVTPFPRREVRLPGTA